MILAVVDAIMILAIQCVKKLEKVRTSTGFEPVT